MPESMNYQNGFCVRVNLYIIREVFKKIKKQYSKFLGRNAVLKDFYDLIGIDRHRFQKIMAGENFRITKDEREKLTGTFNIEDGYFVADGNIFDMGLDRQKWECFFNQKFQKGYGIGLPDKIQNRYHDEVSRKLGEIKKFEDIKNVYTEDSAIFRISYYFHEGRAFREEKPIQRLMNELDRVDVTNWDELAWDKKESRLKEYREKLEKHAQYVQSLIILLENRK